MAAKVSVEGRRQFVKHTGLPIHLVDEPYFSHLLDLYEPVMRSRSKYNEFLAALKDHYGGKENEFLQNAKKVCDDAIAAITQSAEYGQLSNKFDAAKFKRWNFNPSELGACKDIYTTENCGKKLISLDMKQANFNALRLINPALVRNAATYEAFMATITDDKFLIGSKHLRQVIFGKANPKQQVAVEQQVMYNIAHTLHTAKGLHIPLWTMSVHTDEVVHPQSHALTSSDNYHSGRGCRGLRGYR
eukprot:TRINITY_DN3167_c0_g1_i1.p1 TRINITY_DN3167_c0_g1~~TRINITY_DN3167_c0_g1_i1.p1  ORF type:complete len:245 (+),score=59.83 TRINITY_DN3167_c0_g1_i1:73-807(+)